MLIIIAIIYQAELFAGHLVKQLLQSSLTIR